MMSPLVIWLMRTPLDGAHCNVLLLAFWSVHQKLNHVSSVQFSYVSLYAFLCY